MTSRVLNRPTTLSCPLPSPLPAPPMSPHSPPAPCGSCAPWSRYRVARSRDRCPRSRDHGSSNAL
eukprot:2298709-Rhodomonas_salina.1